MWALPTGASATWFLVIALLRVTRRIATLRILRPVRAWLAALLPCVALHALFRVALSITTIAEEWSGVAILVALVATVWMLIFWICALPTSWAVRSGTLALMGSIAATLGGAVVWASIGMWGSVGRGIGDRELRATGSARRDGVTWSWDGRVVGRACPPRKASTFRA